MDAFYGEIRAFPYTFPPVDWAYCNGTIVSVQQYTPLFALIGTTFGGDGKTTFGLPNLNGLTIIGEGQGPGLTPRLRGGVAGEENLALSESNLAQHNHAVTGALGAQAIRTAHPNTAAPLSFISTANNGTTNELTFDVEPIAPTAKVAMAGNVLSPYVGAGGAHENRQPVLPLTWCIAITNAIWPQKP
jgi:microcystin-dependent protein